MNPFPRQTNYRLRLGCLVAAMLATLADVDAQPVPPLINYQGRLSNPDGSPVPTADYTLTFKVFDATTNGTLVWGPQAFDGTTGLAGHGGKIPVVQGYFNVMLGPVDVSTNSLLNAFSGTNRFVEITVGTNNPIVPRQQVLSAPFAFQAANSAQLAGYDWSSILVSGSNNPSTGKISGSKIETGGLGASQIASNSITPDRLALRTISTNGSPVLSGGLGLSRSCGGWTSPTPAIAVAVSNFNLSITTRGNPVEISFFADGATNSPSYFYAFRNANPFLTVSLLRNGEIVGVSEGTVGTNDPEQLEIPPGGFRFVDLPPAGIHSYQVKVGADASTTVIQVNFMRMLIREL